jgi:radical SAM protein with 4Fe4S-binding SPASM domain
VQAEIEQAQAIVMRHNERDIPAMRHIAREMGTLLRLKSVGLGDLNREPGRREWLPEDKSLRRYDAHFNLARGKPGVCDHPWHRLVVNWDGQVAPCCYDPDGEYEFGNAADGMGAVWNGERLQAFRRAMQSSERPTICQKCSAPLWNSSRIGRVEKP